MVDAGLCWDPATALARAQRLKPYGIAWLEEPLSQDDLAGYAELCPRSPVPIAAGEGGVTRWDFEELIRAGVHILQPDVAFCGGLTVCREASRMALLQAGGACLTVSARGSTSPLRCTGWPPVPTGDLVEYCLRPSPLIRHLVRNLPPLVDGRVPVPDGPGLGIDLDESILERYRVPSDRS